MPHFLLCEYFGYTLINLQKAMIKKQAFLLKYSLLILLATIMSCKDTSKEPVTDVLPDQALIAKTSEGLNTWFETQFQAELNDSPEYQTYLGVKTDYGKWNDISGKKQLEKLAKTKERLQYLKDSVQPEQLDDATRLSYTIALQDHKNEIKDFEYRLYNYPVNQMHGMQSGKPAFMINMHRVSDKSDAEAYISRLKGMQPLFEQLIENLKIREKNGILPPKFVYGMILDDCRNIIKGQPFEADAKDESTLFADFKKKIAALELPEDEKTALITDASEALSTNVKSAYEALITFVSDQQKRATSDDGAWKFPKGKDFYNNALKRTTTTDLTADEIHQIGLDEVARIHGEMKAIMTKVKFEGSLQEFFEFMRTDEQFYYPDTKEGKAAYLAKATALIDTMKTKLDQLFITKPKADLEVRAVEPFREKSAGKAFYNRGTPDGSRPGYYYANLYDMESMPIYQMEALAYHEGLPGHHMQISIAQELKNVPKFRKYGGYTAYVEGWGLYNEFVPKEIGLYSDPYSDFGRLAMELWRACRLVVDTGIHAKKWTREEGIEYYKTNTPNAERDAIKMVERHIVMPSQATAYKVGMLKILELRKKAKTALGEAFDIREFHDAVLTNGAVPLNILEELIDAYISKKKAVVAQS